MSKHRIPVDLTGHRFDRWLVLEKAPEKNNLHYWKCRCDCGTEKTVYESNLIRETSKSCGCLARELTSINNSTHGKTRSPTHTVWMLMKQRCLNSKIPAYKKYGGRGITICDAWLTYEGFVADMGERPAGMSLDRYPDNNGNYEPSNCRWATPQQQARNRRSNAMITYKGETKCIAEFAEQIGIDQDTLSARLRRGLAVEDALTNPLRVRSNA